MLVGGPDFAHWEHAVDNRLQPSREDVAQNLLQLAHGSHVGTENSQLPGKEMAEFDVDGRAAGGAAGHKSSGILERLEAFVPGARPRCQRLLCS